MLCISHQYGAAAAVLTDMVRQAPAAFDCWALLAQIHLRLRDYDAALTAARAATALRPRDAAALYAHGRVHKARGNIDAAEDCYRRAIESDPDDPNPLT